MSMLTEETTDEETTWNVGDSITANDYPNWGAGTIVGVGSTSVIAHFPGMPDSFIKSNPWANHVYERKFWLDMYGITLVSRSGWII